MYRSNEYFLSFVITEDAPNCPTKPAACQVVPEVSWSLSNKTTSFQPNFDKWYAQEQPATPPPITTTFVFLGSLLLIKN